jgi:hypothetical protein
MVTLLLVNAQNFSLIFFLKLIVNREIINSIQTEGYLSITCREYDDPVLVGRTIPYFVTRAELPEWSQLQHL